MPEPDATLTTNDERPGLRLPPLPIPTITPEQFAAVSANLAPLATAMRLTAQELGAARIVAGMRLVGAFSMPRDREG